MMTKPMDHTVEKIVYGEIEAMIAEYAAFDPRTIGYAKRDCKYLVMPTGAGEWDTEWFSSITEARKHARYLAKECNNVPVMAVY